MEIELELESYRSLNDFFTRRLRADCRPIAKGANSLISPVDGQVSMLGSIAKGQLIQAKGKSYTLAELLQGCPYQERFQEGKYCTLYLSPRDYHRIHFPCSARVIAYSWLPGRLLPVNQTAVGKIERLFPQNERLVSLLRNERGLVALVKVGAFNVGSIRISYDEELDRELYSSRRSQAIRHGQYQQAAHFLQGDELGYFEMGSTVILLFEKDRFHFAEGIQTSRTIRYGEKIGDWKSK